MRCRRCCIAWTMQSIYLLCNSSRMAIHLPDDDYKAAAAAGDGGKHHNFRHWSFDIIMRSSRFGSIISIQQTVSISMEFSFFLFFFLQIKRKKNNSSSQKQKFLFFSVLRYACASAHRARKHLQLVIVVGGRYIRFESAIYTFLLCVY